MSGLIQAIAGGHSTATDLTGSVVQSSIYGIPIPVIYGLARVAGNLIHMPQDPHHVKTGGSKFGSPKASAQDIYAAPAIIALCEGPVGGVGLIWADKDALSSATAYSAAGWDFSHVGSPGQTPWSYLTGIPAQAVSYPGICYVANASVDLPGYHLRNYSWEVNGALQFSPGAHIYDALPPDIATDILTNAQYGYGWRPYGVGGSLIGDMTAWSNYCAAAGLFVSPAYTDQRTAAAVLQELLDASNSAAIWSDGLLKFVPFGDTALSGNGRTYTPNTTPIYDLTDDDFMAAAGEDPVKVSRKPTTDAYNQIFVEFQDRLNEYNPSTAEAKDQTSIEFLQTINHDTGLRPSPKVALPLIKNALVARLVAQLILQREQNVRNTYTFRVGLRYALLEPMDLVTLTDTNQGLSLTPVRIVSVTETADEQGIDIEAEDWPFGTATATMYPQASGIGYSTQATISPGNTATPIIFDGPQPLASSPLEIWIAASGGAVWGGCEIWYSTDNVAFYRAGTINQKANFGVLTALLASGTPLPGTDSSHTLAVDLSASLGALVSVSATDFAALTTLCYVDGEFLAYETASLTSAFHYNLTTLGRGAYGSTVGSHAIGTEFVLCDGAVYRLPFPQGKIGQTIYFKFPAFNQYGGGLQDISSVSSVPFVIGNVPGEPTVGLKVTINSTAVDQIVYNVQVTNLLDPGSSPAQTFTLHMDNQGCAVLPNTDQTASLSPGQSTTFTYTVYRPIVGGVQAAVQWTASAPGWNAGRFSADISNQGQDSSQPVTISIDVNGYPSARFNGASNQNSWRWASTQGVSPTTPSDASAIAGTLLVGRTGNISVGSPLAMGDSIILKAVPFTDNAGSTGQGQIVTVTETRQNKITNGKRVIFPGGLAQSQNNTDQYVRSGQAIANNNPFSNIQVIVPFELPNGVTIAQIESNTYRTVSGDVATVLFQQCARGSNFPTNLGGCSLMTNSTTGAVQLIQQAISAVVDNANYTYFALVTLNAAVAGFPLLFDVAIVYTSSDLTQTI